MSTVKKEVNEARAAKKDWEAACRALDRKRGVIGKERDRLAEEMEEKRGKGKDGVKWRTMKKKDACHRIYGQ